MLFRKLTLGDLIRHLPQIIAYRCNLNQEIEGISIDTRQLKANELWIALSGEKVNGHAFLQQATQACASLITETPCYGCDLPYIQVIDNLEAIEKIGHLYRSRIHAPVCAVTGTCGKTTVVSMIRHILNEFHAPITDAVLSSIGNFNNHLGVPITLSRMHDRIKHVVLEVGTNQPGDIEHLARMTRPNIAVINSIGAGHLEKLRSIDGVLKEKNQLFFSVPHSGYVIAPHDVPVVIPSGPRVLRTGTDIRASHIRYDAQNKPSFKAHTPEETLDITLDIPGSHAIHNALSAIAAAYALNIKSDAMIRGLAHTSPVQNRMTFKTLACGALCLDDTYNANPMSFQAALECLVQIAKHQNKRPIVCMGDMLELGDQAIDYHQKVGHQARSMGIFHFYSIGTWSRYASEAFGPGSQHLDSDQSMQSLVFQEQDVVLVKGSHAMRMDRWIEHWML